MLIYAKPLSKEKFAEYSPIAAKVGRIVESLSESLGRSKRSVVEEIWRGNLSPISFGDASALAALGRIESEIIDSFAASIFKLSRQAENKWGRLIEGEDIQQDLMLEIRYALYQYTQVQVQFSTFFYHSAFNRISKYQKRMWQEVGSLVGKIEDEGSIPAREEEPLYEEDMIEMANNFIRSLPEADRDSLLAKLGERGDISRLAEQRGCFRGSVNHSAQKCINKFRKQIKGFKKSA